VLSAIAELVDHHYWLPLFGHNGLSDQDVAGARVPIKTLPCWALFTEAHITCDGRLSACPLDASARFHMADLAETPFAEAWHSDAFQALRRHHLERDIQGTACESCIAY
jgi:radical SAM protein with 4Fe4S-binding SPASM domain